MKRVLLAWAVLPLAVTLAGGAATAQSDIMKAVQDKLAGSIAKLEASCSDDIKKYCSNVTPGEGRLLHCMQAYEDKISPKCAYDAHDAALNFQIAADRLQLAVTACRDDIAKLCGKTAPGQGRIAQCLISNKAATAPQCAAAIDKLEAVATAK